MKGDNDDLLPRGRGNLIEQRYGEEHAKGPPRDAEDSGGIGGAVAGLEDGGGRKRNLA